LDLQLLVLLFGSYRLVCELIGQSVRRESAEGQLLLCNDPDPR
jgi:hypothetical protein